MKKSELRKLVRKEILKEAISIEQQKKLAKTMVHQIDQALTILVKVEKVADKLKWDREIWSGRIIDDIAEFGNYIEDKYG